MKNFLFICSLLFAAAVQAHGGDEHKDHAHAAPAAVLETNAAVPTLTTQSETFELVARLYEDELGLYIDYWGSNAPVLNASSHSQKPAMNDCGTPPQRCAIRSVGMSQPAGLTGSVRAQALLP